MARYVFAVAFRLDPTSEGVTVEPSTFQTTFVRSADSPGEDGWLFFRDHLWRGDLTDATHFRRLVAEELDVTVLSVEYRRFETTDEEFDALREAIAVDLDAFNADSVSDVVNKYFGSSVEVES